jgi:hypothetical protein
MRHAPYPLALLALRRSFSQADDLFPLTFAALPNTLRPNPTARERRAAALHMSGPPTPARHREAGGSTPASA